MFSKLMSCLILAVVANSAFGGAIKNEQTILGGSLVRAGVKNQEPLSEAQLKELCERGFSKAYYLYKNLPARTVSCGNNRSITYKSQSWLNPAPILDDVNRDLTSRSGHVFVHCNNGAHASGYVAAIVLRQFCAYSGDQALDYWNRTNSYGIPPAMRQIQSGLRSFGPLSGMTRSGNCP